jgi:hypothetical protein
MEARHLRGGLSTTGAVVSLLAALAAVMGGLWTAWRLIEPNDSQALWLALVMLATFLLLVISIVLFAIATGASAENDELRQSASGRDSTDLTVLEQQVLDEIFDVRFVEWSRDARHSPGSGAIHFTRDYLDVIRDLRKILTDPRTRSRISTIEDSLNELRTAVTSLSSALAVGLFPSHRPDDDSYVTRHKSKKMRGEDGDVEDMDRALDESESLDELFLNAADAYDAFVETAMGEGLSPTADTNDDDPTTEPT